jgi:hypothetical protein
MRKAEKLLLLKDHLVFLIHELKTHAHEPNYLPKGLKSFSKSLDDLNEFLDAHEYGIAYELIVALLEKAPFSVTAEFACSLLKVGLLLDAKNLHDKDFFQAGQ